MRPEDGFEYHGPNLAHRPLRPDELQWAKRLRKQHVPGGVTAAPPAAQAAAQAAAQTAARAGREPGWMPAWSKKFGEHAKRAGRDADRQSEAPNDLEIANRSPGKPTSRAGATPVDWQPACVKSKRFESRTSQQASGAQRQEAVRTPASLAQYADRGSRRDPEPVPTGGDQRSRHRSPVDPADGAQRDPTVAQRHAPSASGSRPRSSAAAAHESVCSRGMSMQPTRGAADPVAQGESAVYHRAELAEGSVDRSQREYSLAIAQAERKVEIWEMDSHQDYRLAHAMVPESWTLQHEGKVPAIASWSEHSAGGNTVWGVLESIAAQVDSLGISFGAFPEL